MKAKKRKSPGLVKFLIVAGLVILYMIFAIIQFGLRDGLLVTALSWSFFVFCTPIADAGFLLDFPIRLLTGFRMLYTEIIVWVIATILNIFAFTFLPTTYTKTPLLQLFHKIILTPWPLWIIIFLSAIGTFVSIYLGDDAFDIVVAKNKLSTYQRDKLRIYFSVATFVLTFIIYFALLAVTHTQIRIF